MAWWEEHAGLVALTCDRLRQAAACPATARAQSVWLERVQGAVGRHPPQDWAPSTSFGAARYACSPKSWTTQSK
eukprot:scaffold60682_cov69-Phaeocystis_antarctica.AAC.2